VLTGHDSVKEGNTYKIISEAKPAFVGIDEAHEIIQETSDSGAQSKRLKAMKSMADSAEYFVAGTGTTVKNSIAELGTLLHIARPDVVTDPKKFGKKYENINQGTVVFQNGSTNQFRREFDDIMLSRRSEVEGAKLIETKEKVKITPEQKKAYSQTEKQYRLDRDNKGKFGVFDKETGKMDFLDADTLKTFDKDSVNFSVGGDVPSPKEVAFLKANGFDGKRIVELGGTGASQRRDYGHERTLHSGDWKTNAKLSKMVENIKKQPDAKHGILYKNKFSKPAVTKALLDNGYTEDQIVFIDGSVVADKRDKAVTDFQQNPNVKVIVFGEAGATGLNLQAMDNLHHLTRLDTYAKQQQANARGYRKGRKADVNAYYYDSDTPLDNRKVESIERKKKISQSVGEYKETANLQDF
jgi:SNF2 family DNA or RNA helicase